VESKLNLLVQQYQGVREDASELKEDLDQAVERMASQLDVATRLTAISRLTSGVAHEIKNPLNAIALRLDLLRARLDEPSEVLSGEIDILSREVLRLDRVVKTFLDFSKPVDVKLQEVDLAALAGEVTDLMAPQARLARINLSFEAPAEASLIRGDADMLKQAVLNLVTNAFEAMTARPGPAGQGSDEYGRNGGCVRVSVGRTGEVVTLQVADNGPGIPAEVRDRVFQLYFTTKTRGSGIGLAMTYRAVQLHNGTIEFVSDHGGGTTFRLQFPAWVRHA
jgi:signal transduction histidine kinase